MERPAAAKILCGASLSRGWYIQVTNPIPTRDIEPWEIFSKYSFLNVLHIFSLMYTLCMSTFFVSISQKKNNLVTEGERVKS